MIYYTGSTGARPPLPFRLRAPSHQQRVSDSSTTVQSRAPPPRPVVRRRRPAPPRREPPHRIAIYISLRGKLTSRLLSILVDPRRATLSVLPLRHLRSIDEASFLDGLRRQKNLAKIDISFSPCLLTFPRPFVELLPVCCQATVTHFSANHVRDVDFGLPLLRDFTHLTHLDVSFTSSPFNVISGVIKNFRHLEYVDVSGNDFSWYQVFSLSLGPELEHLGMASLRFVHEDERSHVFERPNSNFDTKWISRFFSSDRRLASLDITYADSAYEAILA